MPYLPCAGAAVFQAGSAAVGRLPGWTSVRRVCCVGSARWPAAQTVHCRGAPAASGATGRSKKETVGMQGKIIWTERGVWLQTVDGNGQVKVSDCGRLSLQAVREFCEERGIELHVCSDSRHASPILSLQFPASRIGSEPRSSGNPLPFKTRYKSN